MPNYLYYDFSISQVCKVKDENIEYEKYPTILSYLNQQCLENGSTLDGRKLSYQYKMKTKKYTPIFISRFLIYFPTESIHSNHCTWINYHEIESVIYEKKLCTIYFKDHTQFQCSNPNRIKHILFEIQQYLQFYMPSF